MKTEMEKMTARGKEWNAKKANKEMLLSEWGIRLRENILNMGTISFFVFVTKISSEKNKLIN